MFYLASEILVFLALSAALGFFIGWLAKGIAARGDALPPAVDSLVTSNLRAELHSAEEDRHEQRNEVLRLRQELARARVGLGDMSVVAELREELAASRRDCRQCREELNRVREQVAVVEHAADAPDVLEQPQTPPDDLKMINGIGAKLEATLNELGIYYFRQIADFTPGNVAWVNQRLRFRGRIERERWVEQARRLVESGDGEQQA